jgi:uncharacterized protein YuzE
MKYPHITKREDSFKIEFLQSSGQATRKPLRMVVDFGLSGDVLGIEIMNLTLEAGKQALELITQVIPTTGEGTTYGYDEDSDSFYLRLNSGSSSNQMSIDGLAICDEEGRIIALSAELAHSP